MRGPRHILCYYSFAGWSSLVARRAHNPEVVGSNPTPATISFFLLTRCIPEPENPTDIFSVGRLTFYFASGGFANPMAELIRPSGPSTNTFVPLISSPASGPLGINSGNTPPGAC